MYKVIFSFQRVDKVSEKGFETDSCICLLVFTLSLFPCLLKKVNLKPLPQSTGLFLTLREEATEHKLA